MEYFVIFNFCLSYSVPIKVNNDNPTDSICLTSNAITIRVKETVIVTAIFVWFYSDSSSESLLLCRVFIFQDHLNSMFFKYLLIHQKCFIYFFKWQINYTFSWRSTTRTTTELLARLYSNFDSDTALFPSISPIGATLTTELYNLYSAF